MSWERVKAYNIIAVFNGTHLSDEVVVIATHLDTWSIAPKLAFSANEALSIALLLELARFLRDNPPYRTVMLAFLSGHWQALHGAREFIERFYFSDVVQSDELKPVVFINLGPLSADTKGLSVMYGSYYAITMVEGITIILQPIVSVIRNEIFGLIDDYVRAEANASADEYVYLRLEDKMFWAQEEYPYLLESEVVTATGAIGFSIISRGPKLWRGTPLDDYQLVKDNIGRVKLDLVLSSYMALYFANKPDLGIRWSDVKPKRLLFVLGATRRFSGFVTMRGRALRFDPEKGWYSPLPKAIVRVYIPGNENPFAKIVEIADEEGEFTIHGIVPSPLIAASLIGGVEQRPTPGLAKGVVSRVWRVEAWLLDEKGHIEYAPDKGIYGEKSIPMDYYIINHPVNVSTVSFKCYSITIFDLVDPLMASGFATQDVHMPFQALKAIGASVEVYDFYGKNEPFAYGIYFNEREPLAMVFMPEGSVISIIVRRGGMALPPSPKPVLVVTNSSEETPEGYGIHVRRNLRFNFTAYRYAYDLYWLTIDRYNKLKERFVRNLSIEEFLAKAKRYLLLCQEMLRERRYSEAYRASILALMWAYRAYMDTMLLIDDSAITGLFLFSITLLSTFFLERLTTKGRGYRRIITLIVIAVVLMSLLYMVHPVLMIMSNASMSVLGSILLVLFTILVMFSISRAERIRKEISRRLLGIHVIEVDRFSELAVSFSYSLEYMRKRPLRTVLTMITVIVMVSALISLSSTSYTYMVTLVRKEVPGLYNGILIKSGIGIPPRDILDQHTIGLIRYFAHEALAVCPRVWYYPQSKFPKGVYTTVTKQPDGPATEITAILGLSATEVELLLANACIGSFNGFKESEHWIIIPDVLAKRLNVSLGDTVEIDGLNFTVVALLDMKSISAFKDLDGRAPTPVDPLYVPELGRGITIATQAAMLPPTLSWDRVVIIPYQRALEMGGYVSSIVLLPVGEINFDALRTIAEELIVPLDLNVFIGWNGVVYQASSVRTFAILGMGSISIVLVIGALNIALTFIANIRDRRNEIKIFSTLGFSPFDIVFFTFAEALSYSLIGIVSGYFLGFFINQLLIKMRVLPPDFVFNFASIAVVYPAVVIMLVTLLAATYPALQASKLVTPSLRRRWELPTKPKGDEWEIPLMMRIPSMTEAKAIIAYLNEYYKAVGREKRTFIVTEIDYAPKATYLTMKVSLAPFEAKIQQIAKVEAVRIGPKEIIFSIKLKRVSGPRETWIRSNFFFIDDLRKQLLIWRSLPPDQQAKYIGMVRG